MRALGPYAALRLSWSSLMRRPAAALALGLALITSSFAVFCGLGLVAAPWFSCELLAMQLGLGTGSSPARGRSWLFAGAIQLLGAVVLGAVTALAFLAFEADTMLDHGPPRDAVLGGLLSLLAAATLALPLSIHFEHAPALLLDRGVDVASALLESARLVSESGAGRTFLTTLVARGVQLAPALAAFAFAGSRDTLGSAMLWGVALMPPVALGLALGQGMVVASYLAVRPHAIPPPSALSARPSRTLTLVLGGLLAGVLAGPLTVSVALLRPSSLQPAPSAVAGDEVERIVSDTKPIERFVFDTALAVQVSTGRVRVVASDGGGAGTLPLPPGLVRSVTIARVSAPAVSVSARLPGADSFALDVALDDGRTFRTFVDEAGVRLDDSLSSRLASLLPPWGLAALFACLLWTGLWIAFALPPLGRSLRVEPTAEGQDARPARTRMSAALLAPAAAGSIAIGLWALLGWRTFGS